METQLVLEIVLKVMCYYKAAIWKKMLHHSFTCDIDTTEKRVEAAIANFMHSLKNKANKI